MNEEIKDHYQMTLLQTPRRIVDESRHIREIYIQPERLNPEDANNSVFDSLSSQVTMRGRSEEVGPPLFTNLIVDSEVVIKVTDIG